MKILALLALAGYAGMSFASQPAVGTNSDEQPVITQYTYGMKLDIAKVINIRTDNPLCVVGPAWMTYEDSQGKRHILEYRRMGEAC